MPPDPRGPQDTILRWSEGAVGDATSAVCWGSCSPAPASRAASTSFGLRRDEARGGLGARRSAGGKAPPAWQFRAGQTASSFPELREIEGGAPRPAGRRSDGPRRAWLNAEQGWAEGGHGIIPRSVQPELKASRFCARSGESGWKTDPDNHGGLPPAGCEWGARSDGRGA